MTAFRDMVQTSGDGQSTADAIPQTGKLGAKDGLRSGPERFVKSAHSYPCPDHYQEKCGLMMRDATGSRARGSTP